ncbi:MAG: hypothetical protein M2R45_03433 [Verrucomicrobia subdivision 3 bacterium]|nr:hypothetical protein [Limisphaerales bacterium]MCS1416337.1 hypothetical protein [Limisphaerales bacterium]
MTGRWAGPNDTKAGYYLVSGYAEDVNLMHAFDSKIRPGADDELAKNGDPGYTPMVSYRLSDMHYRGAGNWRYIRRFPSQKAEKNMLATRDDYKRVKLTWTNTRLDSTTVNYNNSTMYWGKEKRTLPAGTTATDPSGNVVTLNHDLDYKVWVLKQRVWW